MLVKNENSSFQEFLFFQPFLSSLAKKLSQYNLFLGCFSTFIFQGFIPWRLLQTLTALKKSRNLECIVDFSLHEVFAEGIFCKLRLSC